MNRARKILKTPAGTRDRMDPLYTLLVITGDYTGQSLGRGRKNRGPVSRQFRHDKDPSMLKDRISVVVIVPELRRAVLEITEIRFYKSPSRAARMVFDITRTVVIVWVCSGIVVSLEQGEIAIKDESSFDLSKFRISDGRFHLEAYVSKGKLSSCMLTQDSKEIDSLLNSHPKIENIGEYAIQEMFDRCIRHMASKPKRAAEDNESSMPFSPEKTGQPAGPGASGIGIFPGTKWCGLGNEADTYADLGKFKETDACCRAHDQCPYFIDHFETKYNYHNPYPWTLSHCDCDNKLYSCLKSVNTTTSNEVGKLFFGVLSVDCFTFNEGKYCQKEHWSHLFCEKYTSGQRAVTQSFPHKWSDTIG